MGQMIKHESVLLRPTVEGLNIKPDGVYVDATFGAGGHSKAIIDKLDSSGRLIAFDQDADVSPWSEAEPRLTLVRSNFRYLEAYLDYFEIDKVDGILADLGVSSHHLDTLSRGFSYRSHDELDMRMNQKTALTAAQVLNTYSDARLLRIMSAYGEVRNARTLVRHLIASRKERPFGLVSDFVSRIEALVKGPRDRYLAQVFQALRIEVNDELGALEQLMEAAGRRLAKGGRLSVISFHSLEDRIVKRFMRAGKVSGEVEKDFYGQIKTPFKLITKKAQMADEEELRRNPRSRSAKLRIAEKI